ncbi:cytochrome P450 [Choanephora cucurbitarum]|nr:cytochrome P450 [Choanephora cucurbitarum]
MNQLSSLKNTAAIQNLLELYNLYVLPNLTKRNKKIGISAAVVFSMIYFLNRLLKPPKHLRQFPYVSYYTVIKSAVRGEAIRDFDTHVIAPLLDKSPNQAVYLRPLGTGWNVMIADPELAKTVFLKTENFPKAVMPHSVKETALGRFLGENSILVSNGQEWKSQRKLANPAFHRSMPVNLFGKLTLDFFEVIDQNNGHIDFTDLIQRWTLEAIGKAGFGFDFNAIKEKDNDWINTYNAINAGFTNPIYLLFPFLDQKDSFLLSPARRKVHYHMTRFLNMVDQIILQKRQAVKEGNLENDYLAENEKDLLTLMIEGELRGEGMMSNDDMRNNVCVFFLAGHDTTANTLAFAIYYLATYPEIQQRAREEAIKVLGDEPRDVLPTLEQTREFVYINQVMRETLRINGPVSRVVSRKATEDFFLHDTLIPKGTPVNVDINAIHHNKKFWTNPYEFDPSRFAEDGEGTTRKAGSGMAWLPFGSGARQCIGMNFSLYEQRVFLSMLLRRYTWKLPENSIHKNGVVPVGASITSPARLDIDFTRRY